MKTPPPVSARPGVSLGDAIVLGVSSSGPAQTLAVSLAALVAACHYGGVVAVLLAFVPMLGIALGYRRLNRWDPNAGATYAWVARVFHPYLGFLCGWMILLYYTVGTSSLTIPAGTYTLLLLAPQLVDSHWAVALVGGGWNVVVTLLALGGLRMAARFEWIVVVFQYLVLLLVAVAGLYALIRGTAAVPFSWHWFTLAGIGGAKGLMGGLLVACFMYSGWDAAVYVNEESTDRHEHPGQAAVASVVILAVFYAIAVLGYQAVLTPAELSAHAGSALALIASRLLGAPWAVVTSLVVLTGTLATLQAAVIAAARVSFAMARDHVMPAVFRRVHPTTGSPVAATLAMSALNLALLALALATGDVGAALSNVVASLGLLSVLFYGLTAAAACWQGRRLLLRSVRDFVYGGLLPAMGALFMGVVAVESVRSGATPPVVLAYGFGSVAIGFVVAVLIHYLGRGPFFCSTRADASAEI